MFSEIADREETTARTMSTGMAAEKPVKSMLAQPGTKVAKGTPARSDAKVVKTCGGFQAPLMVFSDFYEKQMVEDPPVNRGNAPEPAPDSEPEAETEQVEETPKEQTVTEVETYKMPQIPLPDELPRPGVPKKPSWWEIGWRRLMGRSVNDTIWDRWYPPEPSNYAELVCPCKNYVYLGEINEEELNRLNFELKELSSMMVDSQEDDLQDEVEVGVAINRGTSGGIKVLSGTIMIVGSVAGIAAVAASGGTALPVVVMALGTAMIMFGASDTIEGIGDIQAAISRQGLDQMSYNPVRESVFGGNETAYALTETGVSFVFDVITGMAIAKMPTRLKTPAQAFRATSAAGVATEASAAREAESGAKSTLKPNLQLFAQKKIDFNSIVDLIKRGTKTADGKNIITMLDDETKVIFRMDVGENAHRMINYGYIEPVNHVNIEIQSKSAAGKWATKWNYHIILDELGNVEKSFITGLWKNK